MVSPSIALSLLSLIKSTLSLRVASVIYILFGESSTVTLYRVFRSCKSAAPAVAVLILFKTLTKTESDCL